MKIKKDSLTFFFKLKRLPRELLIDIQSFD